LTPTKIKRKDILKRAIASVVITIALASSLIKAEEEPPSKEVNARVNFESARIFAPSGTDGSFIIGDSRHTLELQERERLREEQRETIAREQKIYQSTSFTTSYTGYGQAVRLYQDYTNNCVIWAKKQTGINRPIGYAGFARIQGIEPRVGAIALEWNHASVVVAVTESSITVHESNYVRNWIDERVIPLAKVRGFIYN
jgi:hypothetical protein